MGNKNHLKTVPFFCNITYIFRQFRQCNEVLCGEGLQSGEAAGQGSNLGLGDDSPVSVVDVQYTHVIRGHLLNFGAVPLVVQIEFGRAQVSWNSVGE